MSYATHDWAFILQNAKRLPIGRRFPYFLNF